MKKVLCKFANSAFYSDSVKLHPACVRVSSNAGAYVFELLPGIEVEDGSAVVLINQDTLSFGVVVKADPTDSDLAMAKTTATFSCVVGVMQLDTLKKIMDTRAQAAKIRTQMNARAAAFAAEQMVEYLKANDPQYKALADLLVSLEV